MREKSGKYLLFILISSGLFILAISTSAHPGRTAADGCHYCRTNCDSWGVPWNQRHCHGGSQYTPPPTYNPPVYIPPPTSQQANLFEVTKVIDGDTIQIETGEKVRYIGIDTPETVHPSKPVECFGKEATAKNKELVEGKTVRLEKDISETDKYGRLLRYVYVGDIFVNLELVKEGYAVSSTYPPDVKYQDRFLEAQQEAREKQKGLWITCRGEEITPENESQVPKNSLLVPEELTAELAKEGINPALWGLIGLGLGGFIAYLFLKRKIK